MLWGYRPVIMLQRLGLPVRTDFDKPAVVRALRKDKKRQSDHIKFVLLDSIGRAVVEEIALDELGEWIVHC